MQSAGFQLDAQPFADRALSAAARSGDENQLHRILRIVVPSFDLFGDLDYLLLLQCLGDLDKVGGVAFEDGLVDIPDVGKPHNPVPFVRLGEHLESLRLLVKRRQIFRMVAVRDAQQYSSVAELHSECLEVACARHKLIIIVVSHIAKRVAGDVNLAARLQQLHLVEVAGFLEYPDGLLDLEFLAFERNILVHEFPHPRADRLHILLSQKRTIVLVNRAEIALGNRSADCHPAFREQIPCGLVQKEAERTAVEIAADVRPVVQKLHVTVVENPESQPFRHVVHLGGQYLVRLVELELWSDVQQGGPFKELFVCSGVFAVNPYHK